MFCRIMNHCVLIGFHSDEQNHVHIGFQNQYNIVNDSRVNMNVFYADYIPALNATVRIGMMNDADAAFNDFMRFTIMGVIHGNS